jgi:endonuclease/exonuclease/phosphatase family metal-dependent hydrolase
MALDNYGGVVSFKCNKDVILIDWFNRDNLDKFIRILKNHHYDKFINALKLSTGHRMSLSDHIRGLYNNKIVTKKWDNLYYYTKPTINKEYPYHYCNYRKINGFNPILKIKMTFLLDDILMNIIKKYKNIDGILRDSIQSKLEVGGIFIHEEALIKNRCIINKLKVNYNDQLHWENWGVKNINIPSGGIILRYPILWDISENIGAISPNKDFKIMKFYMENNMNDSRNVIRHLSILSYNIHGFVNLNASIDIKTNITNILNFVKIHSKKLPLITFQELQYDNINNKRYFEKNMIKMGYNWFYVFNGSQYKNVIGSNILALFFKKHVVTAINGVTINIRNLLHKLSLTNFLNDFNKNIRNMIIADTIYGKLLCVHMPIGLREIKLVNVRKINSLIRKIILQQLINNIDPDIIIGDFNFTKGDVEYKFLQTKFMVKNSDKNSTPYNRVDYVWFKKNNNGKVRVKKNNTLININYSDHLPMIQEL